jgi:hypothetical protein
MIDLLNALRVVSVPLDGTCPKCRGTGVTLEAIGATVDLVHADCLRGEEHRAYAGPVAGLLSSSPLAVALADVTLADELAGFGRVPERGDLARRS